jgi:hypothetical protein
MEHATYQGHLKFLNLHIMGEKEGEAVQTKGIHNLFIE